MRKYIHPATTNSYSNIIQEMVINHLMKPKQNIPFTHFTIPNSRSEKLELPYNQAHSQGCSAKYFLEN
jgi:hypothetical protein